MPVEPDVAVAVIRVRRHGAAVAAAEDDRI
jgi:hypothetical protein